MFLTILPIGQVNKKIVNHVQKGFTETFPDSLCKISKENLQMLGDAYNPRRRQYNSSMILSSISKYPTFHQLDRVLGITDYDLYVPRLNFVFGEAQYLGRAAIISLFRLKPEFYGAPSETKLFKERAVKEAIHEVGHTLGLRHCQNPACIMYFSNSILDTDRKTSMFCEKCNSIVSAKL